MTGNKFNRSSDAPQSKNGSEMPAPPKVRRSSKRPPPPPSRKDDRPKHRLNLKNNVIYIFGALKDEFRRTYNGARWQFFFALAIAVLFALSDALAFYLGIAELSEESGGAFYKVHYWDRAFIAVLLFLAVDVGISIGIKWNAALQSGGSGLFGRAIRLGAGTSFSIFLLFIGPAALRFIAAQPTATPSVFPFTALDNVAIALTAFVLVCCVSAVGGLSALLVTAAHSFRMKATSPQSVPNYLFIGLTILAFTVICDHDSGISSSFTGKVIAPFSANGIVNLLKAFSPFGVDISIPAGYYRLAALVKTAVFCFTVYALLAVIIAAIKSILHMASQRASQSGASERRWPLSRINTEEILAYIPALVASGIISTTAAIFLINENPLAGGRMPIGETRFWPLSILALSGLGLAFAVSYIFSKIEAGNSQSRARNTGAIEGAISLNSPQNARARASHSYPIIVMIFGLPMVAVAIEIGRLGVIQGVGALTMTVSFIAMLTFGILIITGIQAAVRLLKQDQYLKYYPGTLALAIGIMVFISSAGSYGTGSTSKYIWTIISPYTLVNSLMGYLSVSKTATSWIILVLSLLILSFALVVQSRISRNTVVNPRKTVK